ncbi:hypothetical protein TYRP_006208 [Tyrophagus putrescentiae]|nr:hypothetical protein TYRP_006208 [Tyrophagus putrescentiae]
MKKPLMLLINLALAEPKVPSKWPKKSRPKKWPPRRKRNSHRRLLPPNPNWALPVQFATPSQVSTMGCGGSKDDLEGQRGALTQTSKKSSGGGGGGEGADAVASAVPSERPPSAVADAPASGIGAAATLSPRRAKPPQKWLDRPQKADSEWPRNPPSKVASGGSIHGLLAEGLLPTPTLPFGLAPQLLCPASRRCPQNGQREATFKVRKKSPPLKVASKEEAKQPPPTSAVANAPARMACRTPSALLSQAALKTSGTGAAATPLLGRAEVPSNMAEEKPLSKVDKEKPPSKVASKEEAKQPPPTSAVANAPASGTGAAATPSALAEPKVPSKVAKKKPPSKVAEEKPP